MSRGCRDLLTIFGQTALALTLVACTDSYARSEAPPAVSQPTQEGLELETCLSMAMDQQATIRAARASLATGLAKLEALERSGQLGALLSSDLKVRRQQACLGVQAARQGIRKAELETRQAVTFTYLTSVYAAEQKKELQAMATNLKQLKEAATRLAEKYPGQLELVEIANHATASKAPEAEQGFEQAVAALREAIGTCEKVLPNHDKLPRAGCSLSSREEAIALAVANRPEITQADLGAHIFGLEIEAQERMRFSMAGRTLAAGSDLHSMLLPAGQFDEKYQPGPIGPEMPALIPGNRKDRVAQAGHLAGRARVLREKVQALIELESGNAWLRYKQNVDKLPILEKAIAVAHKRSKELRDDLGGDNKISPRDVLEAGLIETTLKQQAIEARLAAIQALATLERATGGGFVLELDWKVAPPRAN